MLNRIFGDKIFCGLDIGAQSLKASVVQGKDIDNIELLAVSDEKTVGLKDSSVSDLVEFSDCIRRVIENVQKKSGIKVKDLHVGVGGDLVHVRRSSTAIPLIDKGSKIISEQDLVRVCTQARMLGAQLDEEILHDFVYHYKVDDVNSALNPIGLYGRKLEADVLLVLCNLARVRNIYKAINQAGFDAPHLFLSSYAASQSCLTDQEKKSGCVFLDVGSKDTDVLVFKDDLLKHIDCVAQGGKEITSSIASDFNLPYARAEEIKKSYASVAVQKVNEEILIKQDQGYVPIDQARISAVIKPSVMGMVRKIKHSIQASKLYDQINMGITVVGGGGLLPGFMETLEKEFNMPVKIGVLTKGLPNSSMYTAAVGVAQTGYMKSLPYSIASYASNGWSNLIIRRVKDLYQEYF